MDDAEIPEVTPSVEITGSRVEKLEKLDTLIAHLQRLRRRIAGTAGVPKETGFEGPSRLVDAPSWPWLAAGVVLGALFVVLLLAARSCAS